VRTLPPKSFTEIIESSQEKVSSVSQISCDSVNSIVSGLNGLLLIVNTATLQECLIKISNEKLLPEPVIVIVKVPTCELSDGIR
jgi:hypothetical protein